MLIHDEKRYSTEHCQGPKVPHQDPVGRDELSLGCISDTSSNTNGNGVKGDNQCGTSDVAKVV